MKIDKIISVSSFAIHGAASLKLLLAKYGKYILPVPSALFTALTNNPLYQKFELPLAEILQSTLKIAQSKEQKIILHIGYLSSPQQVEDILQNYNDYKNSIIAIVVDPVMGDNGKWYVDPNLLPAWQQLVSIANFATPNFTELKLLLNFDADAEVEMETLLPLFKQKFPYCNLIVTSVPNVIHQEIYVHTQHEEFALHFPKHNCIMGGTGDLFTGTFIVQKYIKQKPLEIALQNSHRAVSKAISKALKKQKTEMF
jgi:pyridoxine kinase